ncbi:MAG: D-inositol 3-phosphate glycosyltransferase [Calditrichaeota bacterium]|nr:D-inositol 3-phosphate glycosyltransferase [Calditrichota bacterium]
MTLALVGPLPPVRGGISQYNQSLLDTLRGRGLRVVAVGYRLLYPPFLFPGTSQFDSESTRPDDAHAVLTAWNPLSWLRAVVLLRRARVSRLVLQHWHPFFVPCLLFVAMLSRARTVVVIAHNVLPHEHRALGRMLNPLLFRRADRVIVGSSSQRSELLAIAPAVDARVVPHPAYDRFFAGRAGADAPGTRHFARRAELELPADVPLLVHLGLVREYKGVDVLLRALAGLRGQPFQLLVAGEFYDDPARYEQLIRSLQLGETVRIENRYLPDDELAGLIEAADAVVLPYRHATQSGVAMAALAGGCPVVATRTGALADVVREGENGTLADPDDEVSLRRAVERFLDAGLDAWRARRDTIAADARRRYSWDALADVITEGE